MTYAYYQQVKRGSVSPAAPAFTPKPKEERKAAMDKYACVICSYVYDPLLGDPENDIPPDTPFEKLPDDWVCPVCGAGKEEFEKES